MRNLLLSFAWLLAIAAANAQYHETFSTPDKGYLPDFQDDFTGVTWTLSDWAPQPPAEFGRDAQDYFQTTAAGLLESVDLDEEVCWESPLLEVLFSGEIAFLAEIAWEGYDVNQSEPSEHINVEYQLNNGAWVRHPNVAGANGDPAYTVHYISGTGPFNGDAITDFGPIPASAGDEFKARVCVSNNANAEIVRIDNVQVLGADIPMVATHSPAIEKLRLWPNPASEVLNIRADAEIQEVRIFNALGAEVMLLSGFSGKGTVNVQQLPAGFYQIVATSESQVWAGKFVKQ